MIVCTEKQIIQSHVTRLVILGKQLKNHKGKSVVKKDCMWTVFDFDYHLPHS